MTNNLIPINGEITANDRTYAGLVGSQIAEILCPMMDQAGSLDMGNVGTGDYKLCKALSGTVRKFISDTESMNVDALKELKMVLNEQMEKFAYGLDLLYDACREADQNKVADQSKVDIASTYLDQVIKSLPQLGLERLGIINDQFRQRSPLGHPNGRESIPLSEVSQKDPNVGKFLGWIGGLGLFFTLILRGAGASPEAIAIGALISFTLLMAALICWPKSKIGTLSSTEVGQSSLDSQYDVIPSKPRRESIPRSVRMFVWQRDNGRCVKCGSNEKLHYDHIIPWSLGGSNTERNLQLLCEPCNLSKSAKIDG